MPPATAKKKAEDEVPELTDASEDKATKIADSIRAGVPAKEKDQRLLADAFLGALREVADAGADANKLMFLEELAEKTEDKTLQNYLDHAEKSASK